MSQTLQKQPLIEKKILTCPAGFQEKGITFPEIDRPPEIQLRTTFRTQSSKPLSNPFAGIPTSRKITAWPGL